MLNENQARSLVETYIINEGSVTSTQEILDSGEIPELQGYTVRPGKVSDSIFGGYGSYVDKNTGETVEFDNPSLNIFGVPARIMVRTQRISTHDITRGEIPFKDQILAVNHDYMKNMLVGTIGTSQHEIGLGNTSVVIVAEDLTQIPFENVLRAYMAKSSTSTSLYQYFIKGEREFCGHGLPDDLIVNGKLPYVMDTPSTKSDEHDESVSPYFLFEKGICTPEQYTGIRNNSMVAFGQVTKFLLDKGIILVDTKTEHGINSKGEIVAQDELYTMDSSRFWKLEDYKDKFLDFIVGETEEINPKSYSKEFARGFSKGDEGYTDEQRIDIAVRYIEGIQHLLGRRFKPDIRSRDERVIKDLETVVNGVLD